MVSCILECFFRLLSILVKLSISLKNSCRTIDGKDVNGVD